MNIDERILKHKDVIEISVLKYASNTEEVEKFKRLAMTFLNDHIHKYDESLSDIKTFISIYTKYAILHHLEDVNKIVKGNKSTKILPLDDVVNAKLVDDTDEVKSYYDELNKAISFILEELSDNHIHYYLITRSFGVGGHKKLSATEIMEETDIHPRKQKQMLADIFKTLKVHEILIDLLN